MIVRTSRRYGRFSVPTQLAYDFSTDLKRVMGQCIVVRAEQMFLSDTIEDQAISDHFRVLDEGEIAPTYRWVFTEEGDIWAEELKP